MVWLLLQVTGSWWWFRSNEVSPPKAPAAVSATKSVAEIFDMR